MEGRAVASEAWLGLRKNTLNKKLDVFSPNLLEGVRALDESELCELDYLAELLAEPDKNIMRIEHLYDTNEKMSVLTNNTQNIYYDAFK